MIKLELDFDTREAHALLDELARFPGEHLFMAAQRVAGDAKRHALELLDRLIYNTPPRGGYVRTGNLRRSVDVYAHRGAGEVLITLVAGMPYAGRVSLGTLGNRITPERAMELAAAQWPSNLLLVEFGRPSRGMEPRPFIFPSLVFARFRLREEIEAEIERLVRRRSA